MPETSGFGEIFDPSEKPASGENSGQVELQLDMVNFVRFELLDASQQSFSASNETYARVTIPIAL